MPQYVRETNTVTFYNPNPFDLLGGILPTDKNVIIYDYRYEDFPDIKVMIQTLKLVGSPTTRFRRLHKLPSSLQELTFDILNTVPFQVSEFPPTLRFLKINYCRISEKELPPLPTSLESLSITGCNFTSIPPLPNGLQFLEMSHNSIKKLPSVWPPELRSVDLERNFIEEFETFPRKLETMNLRANPLKMIPPIKTEGAPTIILNIMYLREPFKSIYRRYFNWDHPVLGINQSAENANQFLKETINKYYKLQQGFKERRQNLKQRAKNLYTFKQVYKQLPIPENLGSELGSFASGFPPTKTINQQINLIKQKFPEFQPYGVTQQPILPAHIQRRQLGKTRESLQKLLKNGGKRKRKTRKQ